MRTKLPADVVELLRDIANDYPGFADELRTIVDVRECGGRCDFITEREIANTLDADSARALRLVLDHDLAVLETERSS